MRVADGGLAGTLLPHTVAESATQVLAAARASRGKELWASVAGLAAQVLGCERVDLLHVQSLADGGGSGAMPIPPPPDYSDAVSGATNVGERTSVSPSAGAVDSGHVSGIVGRGVQTTGVNTSPSLGGKRSGNSSMSPDAILPPLNHEDATAYSAAIVPSIA